MRTLIVGAALALALAGCETDAVKKPVVAAAPAARVAVSTETVRVASIPDVVDALGTVRSVKQSSLSSRIVATVRAVHVREGDRVRAGQVLVELDDRDVRAQLRRAEAALQEARSALDETARAIAAADRAIDAAVAQEEVARRTHGRYQTLVDRGLIAAQDYDEVAGRDRVAAAEVARAREVRASLLARRAQNEAAVTRAQAELDNAAITLDYATLRAPGAAIVVSRTAEPGNLAAPGVVLLTLDEERYRLEALVQESDLSKLRGTTTASVSIDALRSAVTAPIAEIVPASDPASRTFVVKLALPGHEGLKSGLYGRAAFAVGARGAITVPRGAVVTRGQLEAVFVVTPADVATLRLVRTGAAAAGRVEILSGLTEGDRLVVEGAGRLADGEAVQVRS